jgi:hypothetical protein
MCHITTYAWSCGTPLDDGINKCPEAAADSWNPYCYRNLEEKEEIRPRYCGQCPYLGMSLASASDGDTDEYNDEEDGGEEEDIENKEDREDDTG